MRTRLVCTSIVTAVALGVALPLAGQAVAQDEEMLRFVRRAVPYFPGSTFEITEDTRHHTPAGSYRVLVVERECDNPFLAGSSTMLLDEVRSVVWVGSVAKLPLADRGVSGDALKAAATEFLPPALEANLGMKVRLDWEAAGRPAGALLPFTLMVETGYGEYAKQVAITGDGAFVTLGAAYELGRDPVQYRQELLRSNAAVMWDYEPAGPRLDIVEFSDLQCPGCKAKWSLIELVLERHPASVRHGMVSFPLTRIHPWAFRASSAAWCVAVQRPKLLTEFKELFYSIQKEMSVADVTPTSLDFVEAESLDAGQFSSCYLKQPSLRAVHDQISLGQRLGVVATPTYFVDGWMIQVPGEDWFPDLVRDLLDGEPPG